MIHKNIKELKDYLCLYVSNLVIVLTSLTIVSMSLLAIGYVIRSLIDSGLRNSKMEEINKDIFLICLLIITFAIGSFFRSYFINLVTEKIISKLKADTYSSLLKVPIVKFEELKISDIVLRLGSDIENVGKLITNFFSFFIRNLVMLIGGICLMIIQSPKMSLLVIFGVPVLLFPLLKLSKHIRSLSKRVLKEQSNLAAMVEESFSGIRTMHAYNQQLYAAKQFSSKIDAYIKHSSKRLKLRSLFFALAISVIAGSITIVIWIGSMDIVKGNMSSGEMISFIYYAIIVATSAGGIAELFSEIQGPLSSLERTLELKTLGVGSSNKSYNKIILNSYKIEFKNISFAYPSRPDILILKNISFVIDEGKFTAIVGKSGSGKSTIMQLLMKFYQYQDGIIKISTYDISSIDEAVVREKIAYVGQDPAIFSGTIKSNIIFSKPDATYDEIIQIAKLCGIMEFANDLPNGIDTEIGEKGVRISGGQKQRIAIARALLYLPQILLLDEATSAIDSNSEKELLQNIEDFLKRKTIISIAHRISSVEHANKILVINNGKLVSSGSHNELMRNSRIYSILYQEQLVNVIKQDNSNSKN